MESELLLLRRRPSIDRPEALGAEDACESADNGGKGYMEVLLPGSWAEDGMCDNPEAPPMKLMIEGGCPGACIGFGTDPLVLLSS